MGELRDPESIEDLWTHVVAEGIATHCEGDRLAFFALIAHCLRQPKVNPVALLTSILSGRINDRWGRTWRQRPTNADFDAAASLLRRMEGREEKDPYGDQLQARQDEAAAESRRLREFEDQRADQMRRLKEEFA